MKALDSRFIVLLTGIVLMVAAGCVSSLPEAGTADAKLYKEKCTACHSWAHPGRHTPDEWNHYLKLMESHMQKKGIALSKSERETIRNYLHRNAR